MQRLTFANRAELKRIVESIRVSAPTVSDEALILSVSDYISQRAIDLGFERPLARDAISLSYHLIAGESIETRSLARAALQYLLKQNDLVDDARPRIGLQDDYCVLATTVREIATLTGQGIGFNGLNLTDTHRAAIETRVREFRDSPIDSDDSVIAERSNAICDRLSQQDPAGIFSHLSRNVQQLINMLSGGTGESTWARGGLRYLLQIDDVVPDDRGLVGLLDDDYAVNFALQQCNGATASVRQALDAVINRWPFVNWLVIDDNGTLITLSEFALINAGLLQDTISAAQSARSLLVVVPQRGPTAFLVGFLAALAGVADSVNSNSQGGGFKAGDKVFVDSRETTRLFGEIKHFDGRGPYFSLIRHRVQRGLPSEEKLWWPATPEFFARLTAAPSSVATRGDIRTDLSHNENSIRAIDRIVASSVPVHFSDNQPQVLLIGQSGDIRHWAEHLSLFGEKLRDVIPMSHLDQFGEQHPWSSQWKDARPLMLIAPHPSLAVEELDKLTSKSPQPIIVVDGASNLLRQAAIRRLVSSPNRALVVADESNDESDSLGAFGVGLARWGRRDISQLIWRTTENKDTSVRSYENKIAMSCRAEVTPERVECQDSVELFGAVHELQEASDRRKDSTELGEMVGNSWSAMVTLFETVTPLVGLTDRTKRCNDAAGKIRFMAQASLFLTDTERELATRVSDRLIQFIGSLQRQNPKWLALQTHIRTGKSFDVVIRPGALTDEYMSQFAASVVTASNQTIRLVTVDTAQRSGASSLVMSGWMNARHITRLIYPPASQNMTLLLYPPELRSYQAFSERRTARDRYTNVQSPLSIVTGSQETSDLSNHELPVIPPVVSFDLEGIRAKLALQRRVLLTEVGRPSASETQAQAKLAFFTNSSFAYLTQGYRAKVVSHLVGTIESEQNEAAEEIAIVDRDDLCAGDYLLFQKGSEADTIRLEADRLLGTSKARVVARSWHDALMSAQRSIGLSDQGFVSYLRKAGINKQPDTVLAWLRDEELIAPRAYEDVEHIARITNSSILQRGMQQCKSAISEVRSAHLRASRQLATQVIRAFAQLIGEGQSWESAQVSISDSAIVLQLADIDTADIPVRRSLCNRVLEVKHDDIDVA